MNRIGLYDKKSQPSLLVTSEYIKFRIIYRVLYKNDNPPSFLSSGVVHSWKSWIICLTEVIFPEYQCDFRYRASPNYRYLSGTWMKCLELNNSLFYIFLLAKKGLQNEEMSTRVTASTNRHLFPFSPLAEKRPSKERNEYSGNSP